MSRQARSLAVKQAVKNCVYASAGAATKFSGATWIREKLRRYDRALSILMYHKINRTPGNSLSVSPERFKTQLAYLNSHYSLISPSQLLAAVRQGDPLPPRAVLLTFDDGYRDNHEYAYPILQDLGLKALLFVSADFIGGSRPLPHDEALQVANPLLSWSQLLEMSDVFTVGSHARSHRVLTGLPQAEAEHEIESSKVIIEEHLGRNVAFFSYPKGARGDYDEALENKVKASGYDVSFVTIPGANTWGRLRSGSGLPKIQRGAIFHVHFRPDGGGLVRPRALEGDISRAARQAGPELPPANQDTLSMVGEEKSAAVRIHDEQAELFRRRYDTFQKDPYWDTFTYSRKKIDEVLYSHLALLPPESRLLDVGCGTGSHLRAFTERGFQAVGCDASEEMLARARQALPLMPLKRCDAEALPFDAESFDVVTSVEVMRYLRAPDRALAEIRRVLRPGGLSLVTYAPRYSSNFYPLVNQLSGRVKVAGLSKVRQYFHTAHQLERTYAALGFVEVRVHARFFGPFVYLARLRRGLARSMLRAWEPVDDRLAQWRPVRDLANVFVVSARRPVAPD